MAVPEEDFKINIHSDYGLFIVKGRIFREKINPINKRPVPPHFKMTSAVIFNFHIILVDVHIWYVVFSRKFYVDDSSTIKAFFQSANCQNCCCCTLSMLLLLT